MSEPKEEPGTFLSRWSRRKRAAVKAVDAPAKPAPVAEPVTAREPGGAGDQPGLATRAATTAPAEQAFDPKTLPPIESITAQTDIRAFLAPGVPAELTRAALRRAWALDPAIRDYVGLSENSWDFNAPDSIGGFGRLELTDELRQAVDAMMSRIPGEDRQNVEASANSSDRSARSPAAALTPAELEHDTVEKSPDESRNCDEMPQSSRNDVAAQYEAKKIEQLQSIAQRRHGRALPKSTTDS